MDKENAAVEFLAQRYSVPAKTYTGPAPDREALAAILTRALRVPDHGKLQPWRLIVLETGDFATLAGQAEARGRALGYDEEQIAKGRGQFDRGILAVAVIASPKDSAKIPQVEQILSAGALCFSIVVNAQAAGWGANWLSGWPSHDPEFVATAFGLAPQETMAGIIHIATPLGAHGDRPRPELAQVLRWGLAE